MITAAIAVLGALSALIKGESTFTITNATVPIIIINKYSFTSGNIYSVAPKK